MIFEIFLILAALGGVSILFRGKRLSRLLAFFLAAAGAVLLLNFYQNWQLGYTDGFTYDWVSSAYYPVKISLFSSPLHYMQIFPFFVIAVTVMLFNVSYPQEEDRFRFNGQICLNLAALILLICSENAIQLLVSACLIDIFGFYMINDSSARRRYIFYNLLADMGLFMLFALIWGYIGSIRLADFVEYDRLGAHKDLLCILLLLCLFIKSGLFMFQAPLMDWAVLDMNRIAALAYLSTPVVGFIILCKTSMLLPLSEYSYPMLHLFAALSIAWGLQGALLKDDLRQKSIYFNMMLFGFLYGIFSGGFHIAGPAFARIWVGGFLLNACWMLVSVGSSNEVYVSAMGGFARSLKLTLAVTLLAFLGLFQTLALAGGSPYWTLAYAAALALSGSCVLRQIYFGQSHADERVMALLKNPNIVYNGTIFALTAAVAIQNRILPPEAAAAWGIFLVLLAAGSLRFLTGAYEREFIQTADLFSDFYRVFIIGPVKILGRVLWLTIDFLLIERTIINSLYRLVAVLINVFRRIHADSRIAWPLFVLLGAGLAYGSYYLSQGNN